MRVHPDEAEQRKEHVAGGDVGETPSRVRMQAVDDPGCRPSSAVNQPAVLAMKGNGTASIRIQSIQRDSKSLPPPEQQGRQRHDGDEDRPEPDHDVIAVVEQRNVVRPLVARELVRVP